MVQHQSQTEPAEPHRVTEGDQRFQKPALAAGDARPGTTRLGWVTRGAGREWRREGRRNREEGKPGFPGPRARRPLFTSPYGMWPCASFIASDSKEYLQVLQGEKGRAGDSVNTPTCPQLNYCSAQTYIPPANAPEGQLTCLYGHRGPPPGLNIRIFRAPEHHLRPFKIKSLRSPGTSVFKSFPK